MANLGTAYVQIVPAATGIQGKITKAIAPEAALAGTQAGATVAKGMGSKISSLGKGILKAGVIAGAVAVPIVAGIHKAMDAYEVQNAAETKLTEIYKSRMGASKKAAQATIDYAGALQKQGVVGDEVTLSGAQQLATFAKYPKTVNSLLPAMNNLLVQQKGLNGTSQDATQIANLMGKVMQGNTGALKRVGVSFTEAQEKVLKYGTEEEKAAMLSKVITDNVGDMNKAMLATPEGKIQQMKNSFGDLAETIGATVAPVLASIAQWISTNLIPKIQQFITMVQSSGLGAKIAAGVRMVMTVLQSLTPIISQVAGFVMNIVQTVITYAMPVLQRLLPIIQTIGSTVATVMGKIFSVVVPIVQRIVAVVLPIVQRILSVVGSVLRTMISVVTSILNRVKAVFSAVWSAIGPIVSRAVNGIKTVIGGIAAVVGKVRSTFNSVKEAIQKPIETVRDKVKGIIDKIKGFFKFKISPPHIPKPHFGITPKGWKVGDLLKGKIPKLSIQWAAQGGIMRRPTLVGAGEAGSEALLPLDPFWNTLNSFGSSIIDSINSISVPSNDQPVVVSIQVDSKEIARAIAQPMTTEINKIESRNNRKLGYL